MSPLDRRAFLRGLAAAAAGGAAPAWAVHKATAQGTSGRPQEWQRAACPLCPVGCGMLVRIQDGRATAMKGDPASPASAGLACARGYHVVQALYGRDRLTQAMVRRNGRLTRAPLADALDLVAQRLRDAVAEHGPDAVGLFGPADWSMPDAYIAGKLFKGGLGSDNVDGEARLRGGAGIAGLRTTFGRDGTPGCTEDIEHADVFILWDENLAETAPVLFSRMLARRRSSPGVRIIDVTTRTTRTSYAADRSLVHAPHAHLALANAICHDIIARGRHDRGFLDRHVSFRRGRTAIGYGLDERVLIDDAGEAATWSEFVSFLEPWAPERAQAITGMRAEDIRWLASLYADPSLHVLSVWGEGVNRQARGTWLNNALYNIHLLLGRVATPGSGALCVTPATRFAGGAAGELPHGSIHDNDARGSTAGLWSVPADRLPAGRGRSAVELFRGVERGTVRVLWVQSADPLTSLPDAGRYRPALQADACFLVVSDAYPTPTTDAADVVLPSTLWLEQETIGAHASRRLDHNAALVTPPGEATPVGWQLIEVARRLGHAALLPWSRTEYAGAAWEEYRRFHAGGGTALPSRASLREVSGGLWPVTDDGETKWRYSVAHDGAADAQYGAFDFYGHADHRARIWLRPHEPPAEAADREYPYVLRTGDVLEHAGAGMLTRRIPTLHRAVPSAYVEMNGEDARALGIRDGERVRLVSRRGSIEIEARIDYRSQPPRGLVFVPAFDEGVPVHQLTTGACDPLSGQPAGGGAVRIERIARSPS